ncbi:MAG: glycosyltransferase family 4 protein, partial [Bryobacteraceae bacterium]|nr:glycosyltransferase family 4 protein [Bryobacteraceae bacterium]
MVVALDGTPLTLSSGGLRRYTEELVAALRCTFPADEFHALSDQLVKPGNVFERRWWSIGLPAALLRLRCEVFHGTDFAVPYLPLKPSVMSVHDVSPWMNRAWHSGANRVRKRTPFLIRCGVATMLITGTEAVRRQIVQLFGVSPARVVVVPDAPASKLLRVEAAPPERPYFLFVGTVEPRKNVPALIAAWRVLRQRYEVDLIVAGRRRDDGPAIPVEPGLTYLGEVSDQELAGLHSGATALVYPSLYEGFGLPVLEAMKCGTPVITSKDPALLEVSGDAGLHVDPDDLPRAMEGLLLNAGERARQADLGRKRASDFSWE